MAKTSKKQLATIATNERDPLTGQRRCNAPGCTGHGEFKAPKGREALRDYYWFCLDHVRAYNSAWDYFKGMSQGEIEKHMYNTMIWDRPTWHPAFASQIDERLKQRIYERFMDGEAAFADFKPGRGEADGASSSSSSSSFSGMPGMPNPEMEALAAMDLCPPVNWDQIHTRYKLLAKKYHPDLTGNDKTAEELLKKVNLAYSVLKLAWQKYSHLDKN